jgi:hypothetical protein
MPLPFDAREFFEVFARYNTAVWPAQIVLQLAALSAVVLAIRPRPRSDRAIGVILGSLWLWMGGVYHLVFFRSINPAASLFGALFLLEGLLLLGVAGWRERLHFVWTPTRRGTVGAAFLAYALVLYPMLAYALGHRYPALPTFGLPCPTTIFTLGLLAWAVPPRPLSVLTIPLLWSAVAASAAVQFGVWEDFGLVAAGALTLALTLTRAPRASKTSETSRPQHALR